MLFLGKKEYFVYDGDRFEYTRLYERPDPLLPNTWIVIRIDGRGFHHFSTLHGFAKPNDVRALELMNQSAAGVMRSLTDIVGAYGQSDEFSFVLPPSTTLFERRESKLVSTVVSLFTAHYVQHWRDKFADSPLTGAALPTFDGRAVLYPSLRELRDYLSWRQADCHVNNLYNTTFWALVKRGGLTAQQAKEKLDGSVAADKNEILFSQFGINYNNEPEQFKKGSVLFRDMYGDGGAESASAHPSEEQNQPPAVAKGSKRQQDKEEKRRAKAKIVIAHVDIIKDEFWNTRSWIPKGKPPPSASSKPSIKIDKAFKSRLRKQLVGSELWD